MSGVIALGLGADEVRLGLAGGVLLGWSHGGQAMLRSAAAGAEPVASASFPLVPYSNRIAAGCFAWAGEQHRLRRNFPPEPHAIHGCGWQRPWRLERHEAGLAELACDHQPDADWPWAFAARQTVRLAPGRLVLDLAATNLAPLAVPLGFGHHPYCDAAGARLRFAAGGVWQQDAEGLPQALVPPAGPFDFAAGAPVAGRAVDHCYEGWDGQARIEWADRPMALELAASPALGCAVVYVPAGGDYFCIEPVPHATNALNRPDAAAMPVIAPGECFRARLELRAVAR